MARYIDADKLLERMKNDLGDEHDEGYWGYLDAIEEIKGEPVADVAQVVHGEWNWKDRYANRRKVYAGKKYDELCGMTDEDCKVVVVERYVERVPICSICGLRCDAFSLNYCSNCGAKMDTEDDE